MAGLRGRARTDWFGVVLEAPDPQDDCTVLFDPAGHPFCLYLDA
jgi:hypothetical protein